MADIQLQKLLYHLTDIENLDNILAQGLLPRSHLAHFSDVADCEIITSRKKLSLEDYVQFHFFPGSPFDGRVQLNNRQKEFVLITVRRDFAQANDWKIIPTHPLATANIQLLDYVDGLTAIDWVQMNKRDYHDTVSRNACMAECLSPRVVPATKFFSIYVANQKNEEQVNSLKSTYNLSFHVNINQNMFMVL